MVNRSDAKQNASLTEEAAAASGSQRLPRSRISRGQSTVEFAMIAVYAIIIMLVGVQYALLGQAALAVSQGSSAIARYAAVNPGALGTYNGTATLTATVQKLLPSSLLTNGGSDLTVTIASYTGTTTTTTSAPVGTVDRLVITVSYNAKTGNKIALPNPFLGITFPSTLSASDSQMYE